MSEAMPAIALVVAAVLFLIVAWRGVAARTESQRTRSGEIVMLSGVTCLLQLHVAVNTEWGARLLGMIAVAVTLGGAFVAIVGLLREARTRARTLRS